MFERKPVVVFLSPPMQLWQAHIQTPSAEPNAVARGRYHNQLRSGFSMTNMRPVADASWARSNAKDARASAPA